MFTLASKECAGQNIETICIRIKRERETRAVGMLTKFLAIIYGNRIFSCNCRKIKLQSSLKRV